MNENIWRDWADWWVAGGSRSRRFPTRCDVFPVLCDAVPRYESRFVAAATSLLEQRFSAERDVPSFEDLFGALEATRQSEVCRAISGKSPLSLGASPRDGVGALAVEAGALALNLARASVVEERLPWLSVGLECAAFVQQEGPPVADLMLSGLGLTWDALARHLASGNAWDAHASLLRAGERCVQSSLLTAAWSHCLPESLGDGECGVGAIDWAVLERVTAPGSIALAAQVVPTCLEWVRSTARTWLGELAHLDTVASIVCADLESRGASLRVLAAALARVRHEARELEPPTAATQHEIQEALGDTSGLRLMRTHDSSDAYLRKVVEHDALLCLRALIQNDHPHALAIAAASVRCPERGKRVIGDRVVGVSPGAWRRKLDAYAECVSGLGNLDGVDRLLAGALAYS